MIETLQSFQNIFKIPELKRRVLVTAGLLVAYRVGAHVPTPGIDGHALSQFFDQVQGTLLGMVDLFSGGNLRRLSIFALGIMPYISASIILQLLTVVVPALERLAKEGEAGLIKRSGRARVKVLGNGDVAHALTVRAHAVSESARAKIEAKGGRVEPLGTEVPAS